MACELRALAVLAGDLSAFIHGGLWTLINPLLENLMPPPYLASVGIRHACGTHRCIQANIHRKTLYGYCITVCRSVQWGIRKSEDSIKESVFPFSFIWDLGFELRSSGFYGELIHPLTYLTCRDMQYPYALSHMWTLTLICLFKFALFIHICNFQYHFWFNSSSTGSVPKNCSCR